MYILLPLKSGSFFCIKQSILVYAYKIRYLNISYMIFVFYIFLFCTDMKFVMTTLINILFN